MTYADLIRQAKKMMDDGRPIEASVLVDRETIDWDGKEEYLDKIAAHAYNRLLERMTEESRER